MTIWTSPDSRVVQQARRALAGKRPFWNPCGAQLYGMGCDYHLAPLYWWAPDGGKHPERGQGPWGAGIVPFARIYNVT